MSKETKNMIGIVIVISILAILVTTFLSAHHLELDTESTDQNSNRIIVINYEKDVL